MAKKEKQEINFDKCPNCGSTDRLVGRLAQSAKDKGMAREEWQCFMQNLQGVVIDPMKQQQMLVGSSAPAYHVYTDVCMKCGTMYACKILIGSAVMQTQTPAKNINPLLVKGHG